MTWKAEEERQPCAGRGTEAWLLLAHICCLALLAMGLPWACGSSTPADLCRVWLDFSKSHAHAHPLRAHEAAPLVLCLVLALTTLPSVISPPAPLLCRSLHPSLLFIFPPVSPGPPSALIFLPKCPQLEIRAVAASKS